MLNQIVLVGRLRSFEDFGIIIEVPRPETNAGADLIPCTLTGNIANNTKKYCNIGDLVGIKGNYTDNKYGWMNIRNAEIMRVRDGYMIKMPRAVPID